MQAMSDINFEQRQLLYLLFGLCSHGPEILISIEVHSLAEAKCHLIIFGASVGENLEVLSFDDENLKDAFPKRKQIVRGEIACALIMNITDWSA